MRVISGRARGLKLNSPIDLETRPTLDRVKEAVFSMLLPYIQDSLVLDMFSGSGALAIEAISRGAKHAVMVDCNMQSIKCIKNNVRIARMEENSTIIFSDAFSYLKKCEKIFDIIFLDPPYDSQLYEQATEAAFEVLSEEGIVVVEWDYEIGRPLLTKKLAVFKEKKYGRVGITLLKKG